MSILVTKNIKAISLMKEERKIASIGHLVQGYSLDPVQ